MSELWDGTGVTSASLKAEVIRLAEKRPEQTASCIYTRSYFNDEGEEIFTKPGCIVGTAVYNITGKLVPSRFEGANIGTEAWRGALGENPAWDSNSSDDFLFVHKVQSGQDSGLSWGLALQYALNNNNNNNNN